MDCLTSSRLDGVSFTTTLITDNVTLSLGQLNSSANGELELPLTSNGIYNSIVSLPGYITLRHSYQVDIDMTDCSTYKPESVIPLCPPPQKGCTDVSLTWTAPVDLDLHGLQVANDNVTEVCHTKPSCCNGCKKEDCPGVTPHPDSSLGKNGTETITYCGIGTYSDMIYVEQVKGEGLQTSGTKNSTSPMDKKRE